MEGNASEPSPKSIHGPVSSQAFPLPMPTWSSTLQTADRAEASLTTGMNEKEFNDCVDAHSDAIFRFIARQCRNAEDARDVVQNAFQVLWLKRHDVHPDKVKGYLFRVAYNDMIDGIRKQKRVSLVENHDETLPGDPGEGYTGLKEVLDAALNTLPEIQRSVVLLRDYEGYAYREIGEITGLSEAQVKVYIYRARKHLQKVLGSVEKHS